jgi:hypothetical protein
MEMKLTTNELKVLTAIDNSEYGDRLQDAVWTFSVTDNSDLNPRSVPGIIASLLKKDLVVTGGNGTQDNEYHISITDMGVIVYLETIGADRGRTSKKKV